MNILVITREFFPYGGGGLAYHVDYLYSKIADLGHEVTILAGRTGEIRPSKSDPKSHTIDVEWVDYPSLSAYHLQFPISLYFKLKTIDITRYDVVISHTELPYSLEIPTVFKFHDAKHEERKYYRNTMSASKQILESAITPTRQWVSQRSINSGDHLIFNSELTRKVWKKKYDFNTPSTVIYNGVDQTVFYPQNVQQGEFVLFVGNVPRKGLEVIKSFSRSSPYPIKIAGQISEDEPNIESLGYLDQKRLAEYYSSAIATLHPARFEAFGNVILESLACGTPVVLSDQCGAAEIVDDSCGRVTTDLRAGIESVRSISPQSCVQRASDFSWGNVAEKTINLIQNIVPDGKERS